MRKLISTSVVAALAGTALAGDITKPPDLGPWWQPLDPDTGTFIYANSFVADETGRVDNLGMWLMQAGNGAGGLIAFEVYASIGGNPAFGPDSQNVLASTGLLDIGGGTANLDFYNAAPISSATLNAGDTYWFGANVIGGGSNVGSYQVGGHTQNSVFQDNGTFWFSNDPNGVIFGGQGLTPEMAFSVNIIPAPSSLALLGLGGLVATRRRR